MLIFSSADSFHEPCGAFGPALGDASVNWHSCFTATACSGDGEDVAVADARGRLSILARCKPGVCMFCQKPARTCRLAIVTADGGRVHACAPGALLLVLAERRSAAACGGQSPGDYSRARHSVHWGATSAAACRDGAVRHELGGGALWVGVGVAGLAFAPGGDLLVLADDARLFALRRGRAWAPRLMLSSVRARGFALVCLSHDSAVGKRPAGALPERACSAPRASAGRAWPCALPPVRTRP